jgi:ABC-type amino acid transport substrate-binding protein
VIPAKEFFDSGLVRLQKKDIDGAIANMTKTIELKRYVDAYFIRGQCLFLKGDRDSA